jgi:hypothetical protein
MILNRNVVLSVITIIGKIITRIQVTISVPLESLNNFKEILPQHDKIENFHYEKIINKNQLIKA